MILFQTILAALGPIILGLAVGYFSGKYGFIKENIPKHLLILWSK